MENTKPFISVIMPVYNAERYLRESIESVLTQTYNNFELILINDCSSDNSAQICAEYREKDCRIIFIDLKENVGAGMARNYGLKKAIGTYITFVDSDDTINSDLYEKAVACSQDGSVDMIVWGMKELYFNSKGVMTNSKSIGLKECYLNDEEKVAKLVLLLEEKTLLGYQCNKFYKNKILKEYNIDFEKTILYEDFFFTINFLKYISSIALVEGCGYNYYKRFNGNITSRTIPEYFELSSRRVQEMWEYCVSHNIEQESVNILGNIFLRYILSSLMRMSLGGEKKNSLEKKRWINELINMPLYKKIVIPCDVNNKMYAILKKSLKHENWRICFFIGKIVAFVKKYGPMLFEQAKK